MEMLLLIKQRMEGDYNSDLSRQLSQLDLSPVRTKNKINSSVHTDTSESDSDEDSPIEITDLINAPARRRRPTMFEKKKGTT